MPIYAYRCDQCGFSKDVLQKISDPLLTVCPSCGESAFKKQVTAAGFQLKGSGWYATDFKGNSSAATPETKGNESGDTAPDTKVITPGDSTKTESASAVATATAATNKTSDSLTK